MTSGLGVAQRRMVGRLSAAFLVRLLQNGRAGAGGVDDPLDILIFAATLQANTSVIQNDLRLQAAYATAAAVPPEALRRARAVSVHAVATSLGLANETTRRRVARMVELGRLDVTDAGIWVPDTAVRTPERLQAITANYAEVRRLYRRMRELGLLAPPRGGEPLGGDPPVLAVVLRMVDYVLRTLQALRGDELNMADVMILLALLRANVEHLPERPPRGASGRPRPVASLNLARQMSLPRETMRRRLAALVHSGHCRRTEDGLLAVRSQPTIFLDSAENLANLRRMFSGLDELGVLARWEQSGAD